MLSLKLALRSDSRNHSTAVSHCVPRNSATWISIAATSAF